MKRRKRTNSNVPAKGRLRDMADSLWSLAVRKDWLNRCAVCRKPKCEAHHLIPRENEATRYNLTNGIALCAQHHRFDAKVSPHQNAEGWIQWLACHHPARGAWLSSTVASGKHLSFNRTKTADYYIETILRLKPYVDPDEFEDIVGSRFCAYLEELERQ